MEKGDLRFLFYFFGKLGLPRGSFLKLRYGFASDFPLCYFGVSPIDLLCMYVTQVLRFSEHFFLLSSSSSSSSSTPLSRVLIFLRQTMSLGNTVLELFCCFYSWCLYYYYYYCYYYTIWMSLVTGLFFLVLLLNKR